MRRFTVGLLERGLLIILWLMPFVRIEPAPVDVLIWLLGAYLFLTRLSRIWNVLPPLAWLGVVLLAVAHVSLVWVPDLGRGAFYTLATAEMFVLLVIFTAVSRTSGISRRLAWAYLGGSVLAALLGALAYFGWIPYREIFLFGEMRAMAFFKDPNVFGAYLVPAVILLWGLALAESASLTPAKRAGFYGGMAFALTLGILLSGSRSAWGGLVLGVGLFWAMWAWRERGVRTLFRRGWMVAVGMALALAMSAHPAVSPLLEQRGEWFHPYDSDRYATWMKAVAELPASLSAQLLFGRGPGQSEVILGYATHNLYLRVLYELGLVGIIGLGLLLATVAWGLYQTRSEALAWQLGWPAILVSLLAMSFFIDSLHWRHLFALLGIALGVGYRKDLQGRSASA